VIDAFALPEPEHDLGVFGAPFGRNEQGNRLPDTLLGGIAVDALGSRVPACDHTIEGFAQDGVVGGVHQCSQPQPCLFRAGGPSEAAERRVTESTPDGTACLFLRLVHLNLPFGSAAERPILAVATKNPSE